MGLYDNDLMIYEFTKSYIVLVGLKLWVYILRNTLVFRNLNLKVFVPYDLISRAWDKLQNDIKGKEYDLMFKFKKP